MIQQPDSLIYSDLINSLKTTQDVTYFVCEIDTLMSTFFKSENQSTKEALESISVESAKKITQVFSENNLDIHNKDTVTGFFETLKRLIKNLKVIKLVLAFDPTCKTIENIHDFVRETVGAGYILDIEILEEVLGGAIVIFNGKYNDFTLKKEVEDAFESRAEILKLIHSDSR